MTEPVEGNAARIDRRSAMKKAVIGAGAAGIVWSAPRIEGLSLRPTYAAAASGTTCTVELMFDGLGFRSSPNPCPGVSVVGASLTAGGLSAFLSTGNGQAFNACVPTPAASFSPAFSFSTSCNFNLNGAPPLPTTLRLTFNCM